MAHTFEIYRDKAGEYRVRFKYNSEVIASSEGFSRKASAQNLIDSIKRNAPAAPIIFGDGISDSLIDKLRTVEIPASDRIVRIDHNSPEYKEFESAKKKLEKQIKTGNDFGGLSDEDLTVAANEVYQIGVAVEQENVRPSHLYQQAMSSLLWIADKAGGAVIEALAVATLLALAHLLGIPIL